MEVEIDLPRRIMSTLTRLDIKPALRKIRNHMRDDQRDHQKRRQGPGGKRWKRLAPSTRERYARDGNRRNFGLLGRLPNSKKSRLDHASVELYSPVKWSMAHQAGARVGRGAILPQRQFFWISAKLEKKAAEEIEKFYMAKWWTLR